MNQSYVEGRSPAHLQGPNSYLKSRRDATFNSSSKVLCAKVCVYGSPFLTHPLDLFFIVMTVNMVAKIVYRDGIFFCVQFS